MKDYSREVSEKFEKFFSDPNLKPTDLASAWKDIVDAEKARLEVMNAVQISHLEKLKFWVPIIVSLVGTVALVSTLIFQVIQFNQNTVIARDSSEDTQWRETLNRVEATNGPEAMLSFILLKSFFGSERYGGQAREIGVEMLGGVMYSDTFEMLFRDLMERTTWNNLSDIVKISKRLNEDFYMADADLEEFEQKGDLIKSKRAAQARSAFLAQLEFVSHSMADFLRKYGRPKQRPLRLNSFVFLDTDLSAVDLSNAQIQYAEFDDCDVSDVDLGEITVFGRSLWPGTPWWEAKRISPELLTYLITNWSYETNSAYLNGSWTNSIEQFETALKRLQGQEK